MDLHATLPLTRVGPAASLLISIIILAVAHDEVVVGVSRRTLSCGSRYGPAAITGDEQACLRSDRAPRVRKNIFYKE